MFWAIMHEAENVCFLRWTGWGEYFRAVPRGDAEIYLSAFREAPVS